MDDVLNDYRQRSEHCFDLARQATSQRHREVIEFIAHVWAERAQKRQKVIRDTFVSAAGRSQKLIDRWDGV